MPKLATIPTVVINTLKKTKIRLTQNPLKRLTSNTRNPKWENSKVAKEKVDCVVIGGGVVGIAIARDLSLKGRHVLVLDSASSFGTVTSSRNSQVIHAGIYHHHHSFKAKLCVKGRELLYKYCSERDVPHKQVGKLVVATRESEVPKLNAILARGIENGVNSLRMIEASEAMRMEPELHCVKAIFSPVTGIVDSHSFMLSLLGEAENNGATFSYNTTVLGGQLLGEGIELAVTSSQNLENGNGKDPLHTELLLQPKIVINSAGLAAIPLAKRMIGLNNSFIPDAYYARGHYFSLSNTKTPPFKRLIYPLPEDGGVGVHVTLDLDGQVKFGPDVEWINGIPDIASFLNGFEYTVSPHRAERFYPEIRKYYPKLKEGSLLPGYSGIRPKLSGAGMTPCDFEIQGEDIHGVPGLVNLFGIESPGLTSSLAIAEHVTSRVLHCI